jgi:uncharacterized protein (TIGR03067 family)
MKYQTKSVLVGTLSILALGLGLAAYHGSAQQAAHAEVKVQADEPAPRRADQPKEPAISDKEQLDGTWVLVSHEFAGKPGPKDNMRPQWWYFEEDKVTIYSIDLPRSKPERSEYTYTLAKNKNVKIIEFTNGRRLEGPRTKRPDEFRAIYQIEGDSLRIAIGKSELPRTFTTREGDGVLVSVFKREGRAKVQR